MNLEAWKNGSDSNSYNMSLIMRKPVFGVCDLGRLKPARSATEAR